MDKRQILLIDDELNKCETFLKALDKIPTMFKCTFASNAKDAIRIIKKAAPDYIFVDISNPEQNGLLCLQTIKKIKNIRHIPLFLYSTTFDEAIAKKAAELGALKCIKKPKDARTLTKLFKVLFYRSMRAEVRNFAPRKC